MKYRYYSDLVLDDIIYYDNTRYHIIEKSDTSYKLIDLTTKKMEIITDIPSEIIFNITGPNIYPANMSTYINIPIRYLESDDIIVSKNDDGMCEKFVVLNAKTYETPTQLIVVLTLENIETKQVITINQNANDEVSRYTQYVTPVIPDDFICEFVEIELQTYNYADVVKSSKNYIIKNDIVLYDNKFYSVASETKDSNDIIIGFTLINIINKDRISIKYSERNLYSIIYKLVVEKKKIDKTIKCVIL
jgi:hypothetical protein